MISLVVKVKGKDLFFNADEGMGEYLCDTPMLLDQDQADSIMAFCDQIYDADTDDLYTNDQLEIRQVEIKVL